MMSLFAVNPRRRENSSKMMGSVNVVASPVILYFTHKGLDSIVIIDRSRANTICLFGFWLTLNQPHSSQLSP